MNNLPLPSLNYVDFLILGTILLCFLLGLVTGLVWQVAGMVAVVVGILAALFLGPAVNEAMRRWIAEDAFRVPLAYLAVFSIASMAVRILATVFSKLLERWKLQRFNKLLGGIVGGIKGLAICAVIVVAMTRHSSSLRQAVKESYLASPICSLADWVVAKAKEKKIPEQARETAKELQHQLEEIRVRGLRLATPEGEELPPDRPPPSPPPSFPFHHEGRGER